MADTAKVTFFHHSGLSVEVNNALLIFDYWRGEENKGLPEEMQLKDRELVKFDRVLVFVSHDHKDHFDEIIYSWDDERLPITYILSADLPADKRGLRMKPGDTLTVDDIEVTAYDSTDKGVSFYVKAGGLRIFHAGDLNLWHWREESSLREIAQAEEAYYAAVEPLKRLPMDIVMFPVDPRMGGMYDAGANHFIMTVKPAVFIPIHWQDRPEAATSFARTGRTRYTEVLALTQPRETAEITFDDYELHVQVKPPEKTVPSEPVQEELNASTKSDPFSGTDLPVEDL